MFLFNLCIVVSDFFSLSTINTTRKCNMGLQPLISLFRMTALMQKCWNFRCFPSRSLSRSYLFISMFSRYSLTFINGIYLENKTKQMTPTFSIFRSLSTRRWDIRFKILSTKESEARGGIRKIEKQAWCLQSSRRTWVSRNEIGNTTRNVVLSWESAYCESESHSRWIRYISHGTHQIDIGPRRKEKPLGYVN